MAALQTIKDTAKKIWRFFWVSESIWSWLANIILAFVLIKFIVYPGLGFILETSFPVVAVVSGSMEHDGNFDAWWNSLTAFCNSQNCEQKAWYAQHEISEEQFKAYIFKNGFNKGDIMILHGIEPKNIKIGDVLVFQSSQSGEPIIHRVAEIHGNESEGFIYQTKGDHNPASGPMDMEIPEKAIIGNAIFRVPILGWIKILFVDFLSFFMGK